MDIIAHHQPPPETSNDILYLFLGTGITLLLAVVGYVVAQVNESFKWKRQLKFRAYEDLLRTYGEFDIHLRKLIQFGDDPQYDRERMIDDCQSSTDRINTTIATAQLAGSEKFSEKLNAYTTFVSNTMHEVADRTGKTWSIEEYNKQSQELWIEFRFRAQRDLGIRHWWDKIDKPEDT